MPKGTKTVQNFI